MANTKPCLFCQITIDATNKHLDVTSVAGGDETVTLTEQDYADITALCVAIQTGLQALGGDWAAATCVVSDVGIVTIDSGQVINAVELEWDEGANTATTIGDILGYDTSADDDTGYSWAADYQHQYGWYPNKWPANYGPWNPEAVGGEQRRTQSGSNSKKLHSAFHHFYDVAYEILLAKYVYAASATGSDANKDLETCWQELAQSKWARWCENASVPGTYTEVFLLSPFDWAGVVIRPHTDYTAYDLALRFRKKEA